MIEAFIFCLLILFSIVGIGEFLHFMAELVMKPKVAPEKHLIVPLDKEDAEHQILAVLLEVKWSGKKYADKVVFLTEQLDAETEQRLSKEYKSCLTEFKNGVFYGRE